MFHSLYRISFLAFLFAVLFIGNLNSARAQDNLILVIDSSGSMAGQIERQTKLDIARGAIHDLLGKLKQTTRLGLIAYGHRRKGDCGDIETIYKIGKPDANAVMSAVNRLSAVGKTPLSAAVRQAAQQLNFTEEKATVILVSDGEENCSADPCQLGRELKAKGVDFKVHVVGFDVKSSERAGLQCLAAETGGKYVAARNAVDLGEAIYAAATVAQTTEAEPPAPEPVKESGLRIDIVVSEGGAAWVGEIGLKIFSEKSDLDGKRKEIASSWRTKSGHIFNNLSKNTYLLEIVLADHNHIKKTVVIDVEPDQAQILTVNMDIGQVRFDASLSQEGEAYKGDLGWTILSPKKDLSGKQNEVAKFWRYKSGSVFWLPAGTWQINGVIADSNYLTLTQKLTVEAGGGEAHAFSFNAGTVRFDASLARETVNYEGDLGWTVLSTKKDLSGKRKVITKFWRYKSGGIFLLPAGTWLVAGVFADHNHVKTSMSIEVAPGSEVAHEFNFEAGRVRFDVTVNGQPTGDDLGLTVLGTKKDLAGNQKKIKDFWRVKSGYITLLKAGKYLVRGLLADQKEVKGEVVIDVKAGEEISLPIEMVHQ